MTGIEWTDETWNPTSGCDRVSPGCDHCYALTMAKRLKAMGQPGYQRDGDPRTSGPGFALTMHPDRLDLPLRWRKPRKVFVNSMSDLFHQDVTDGFIARVWAVMALAPQHTFQILTKRHARIRSLLNSAGWRDQVVDGAYNFMDLNDEARAYLQDQAWPLPNVWLGVSVEDQHWADIRIPALLATPAAVRWISAEPLLGQMDLSKWLNINQTRACGCGGSIDGAPGWVGCSDHCMDPEPSGLDWVVAGGESGSGARPMHPAWARQLRDQCAQASVPFLFKQWGAWVPTGAIGTGTHLDCTPTGFVRQPTRRDPNRLYIGAPGEIHEVAGGAPLLMSPEMHRVGKTAAGRLLDGVQYDGYPAVAGA